MEYLQTETQKKQIILEIQIYYGSIHVTLGYPIKQNKFPCVYTFCLYLDTFEDNKRVIRRRK
jgi:hypothetical protein